MIKGNYLGQTGLKTPPVLLWEPLVSLETFLQDESQGGKFSEGLDQERATLITGGATVGCKPQSGY